MLWKNQQLTEKVKEEIKKIPRGKWKLNNNDLNLWDTAKAVLRGKFIRYKLTSGNKNHK